MSRPTLRFALALLPFIGTAGASDHLDTPTVTADPAADIGDLYAWTSRDGTRLELVMTLVGARFSDRLRYSFHVDSGRAPGATTRSVEIGCEFDTANSADCRLGTERVRGEAGREAGIESADRGLRVFAGVRDDPFFNNVRGTRAALDVAGAALAHVARDAGGCPRFDPPTSARILNEWRHTGGGAARNLLAGWKTAALVVSVDLKRVDAGGPLLGVWAATAMRDGTIVDRMGRALTGNALLETFGTEASASRRKEEYNRAPRESWRSFARDIAVNLAIYDGFDGTCGNQWLSVANAQPATRYAELAALLADDRLWVNSAAKICSQYLAVELHAFDSSADCGGRAPGYDAVDVFRSLLAGGRTTGLDDGVDRDDREHPFDEFPFLAAPASETPRGDIALDNLDQLIARHAGDPAVDELLLMRARFFADYAALERVAELADAEATDAISRLRRARARAAVHRFDEAVADLDAAERLGADAQSLLALRAPVRIAQGAADEVIPALEAGARRNPGYAAASALAGAYAGAGRFADADRAFAQALASLRTTSPFPHAWAWFARGTMWAEQAGDARRGRRFLERAVAYLPAFVGANLHLAELELGAGEPRAAEARLASVAASGDPEVLALLGTLRGASDPESGARAVAAARSRFEELLARQPAAFADHAAEFYLAAGADPERARRLAALNFAQRPTARARDLLERAAREAGR
jgi:tetratricopeptide (TPR) repeat protein